MGGIVAISGSKIGSALSEIEQQHSAKKTYRSLIKDADKQAQAVQEEKQKEQENLLQTAAQKQLERYQKYRQEQSAQKAAFAAMGLNANSASVAQFLQNQQWQTQLEDIAIQEDLAKSMEETRQKAAAQIRALEEKAQAARQTYVQKKNSWKLGSKFTSFFS